MKKLKLLFFAAMAGACSLHAQFFADTYNGGYQLTSGTNANVVAGPAGHLMSGYGPAGADTMVAVTLTDQNGNITFSRAYSFTDPQMTQVYIFENTVVQENSGNILVFGYYSSSPFPVTSRWFFLLKLAPNGAVLFLRNYLFPPNTPLFSVKATSLCLSALPATAYACGSAFNGTTRMPVIMSIDTNTGLLNWGQAYPAAFDWEPKDLVEAGGGIALVGTKNNGSIDQGFFMSVAATGAFISAFEYGGGINDAQLNSINVSKNPWACPAGFIVGGSLFDGTQWDAWLMKIDPTGSIIGFSRRVDYSIFLTDNFGHEAIERLNTIGGYEYYLGGYVVNGSDDALVDKLDFGGVPVPGRPQFMYGNTADDERVMRLDQYNGVGPDGLSVFCNVTNTPSFYLQKTYFNGISPCDTNTAVPFFSPGPFSITPIASANVSNMTQRVVSVNAIISLSSSTICFSPAVGGGSNLRQSQHEEAIAAQGELYPNPVAHANPVVSLALEAGAPAVVQLELHNTLGQTIWKDEQTLAENQEQLELRFGDALEAGIYVFTMNRDGMLTTYRFVVE